jgi:tRNA (guanine10-N2)-methyltransferase
MDYLIRFAQTHETFRKPEIQALAELASINIEFLSYFTDVRFLRAHLKEEGFFIS